MDQLTPEEKKIGKDNFDEAVGFTRREFLQGIIAAEQFPVQAWVPCISAIAKWTTQFRVGVMALVTKVTFCSVVALQITFRLSRSRTFGPLRSIARFYGDWATDTVKSRSSRLNPRRLATLRTKRRKER